MNIYTWFNRYWMALVFTALTFFSILSFLAGNWQAGISGVSGAYGWVIAYQLTVKQQRASTNIKAALNNIKS